MALVFEYEKDLETGTQPHISHEKDSVIYNYFIEDERALDRSALAENGVYDDIVFDNEDRHLTTKAVSHIGIKNFPGIGGIGFFKDAYTDESRIVAPIHIDRDYKEAPFLKTVEIVDGKLHVIIEPPEGLEYTCYRIVARQRYFATEYITYKKDYVMDAPPVIGEYAVHCIGYDEANGTVSEDSNEITLVVSTGNADWAPHFEEVGDLIVEINNINADVVDLTVRVAEAEDNILLNADNIDTLTEKVVALEEIVVEAEALIDDINGEVV
jgi:hypothetical protein